MQMGKQFWRALYQTHQEARLQMRQVIAINTISQAYLEGSGCMHLLHHVLHELLASWQTLHAGAVNSVWLAPLHLQQK